ncbi:MAG: hypothetical protein ABUS49_12010, partial [Acidobacteriota bacterium]
LWLIGLNSALTLGLWANDDAARATLTGTWTSQAEAPSGASTWAFEARADAIRITHGEGAATVSDFECNTLGQVCKVKESGKRATVSLWFNGGKLVELETQGSAVTKRRFSVNGDGEQMDLEVIPVSPGGKPEMLHLKRVRATPEGK